MLIDSATFSDATGHLKENIGAIRFKRKRRESGIWRGERCEATANTKGLVSTEVTVAYQRVRYQNPSGNGSLGEGAAGPIGTVHCGRWDCIG